MNERLFPEDEETEHDIKRQEILCPKCGIVKPATGVCDFCDL